MSDNQPSTIGENELRDLIAYLGNPPDGGNRYWGSQYSRKAASKAAVILTALDHRKDGLGTVSVKALQWELDDENWWCAQPSVMIAGGYEVRITDSGKVRARRGSGDWFDFDGTADEAKAHWQSDFETRVKSCLTSIGVEAGK